MKEENMKKKGVFGDVTGVKSSTWVRGTPNALPMTRKKEKVMENQRGVKFRYLGLEY